MLLKFIEDIFNYLLYLNLLSIAIVFICFYSGRSTSVATISR